MTNANSGKLDASAFHPADNPAAIAHLNMMQAVITRLAGNSAQCKTWCLAIVSALLSFAGALKSDAILASAIIPIVVFGVIDAAYLSQDRAYRKLFNDVVAAIRSGNYSISGAYNLTASWSPRHILSALKSWSVWPLYIGLVAVYILARGSGLLT